MLAQIRFPRLLPWTFNGDDIRSKVSKQHVAERPQGRPARFPALFTPLADLAWEVSCPLSVELSSVIEGQASFRHSTHAVGRGEAGTKAGHSLSKSYFDVMGLRLRPSHTIRRPGMPEQWLA